MILAHLTETIGLQATDKHVLIKTYIEAIKYAKANPTVTFSHGLTGFWSCTGEEIAQQYRKSVHERINARAGEVWRNRVTTREIDEERDARDLRNWLQNRIICRRLRSHRLNRRFNHLLFKDED